MSNDLQFMFAEAFYKSLPASWRISACAVELGKRWGSTAVDTVLLDAGEQAREAKDYLLDLPLYSQFDVHKG